ncbi:hypothetical protein D0X20_25435 [Escherichia coli]|nr:hypothetical protein [Escherichia coli]
MLAFAPTVKLPRLPAWPTPHGRTVNCAPVHRYLMSSVPEICPWLQHSPGTGRHSLRCIAMQARQKHQARFSGIWPGKGVGNGQEATETR